MSSRRTTCIPPDRPRKRNPRSSCRLRRNFSRRLGHFSPEALGRGNSNAVRSRSVVLAFGIPLSNGRRHQRPDGALGLGVSSLPIQAIVLPFIAEEFLSILIVLCGVVFLFCRYEFLANANG